jgi:hypothetical protein
MKHTPKMHSTFTDAGEKILKRENRMFRLRLITTFSVLIHHALQKEEYDPK